MVREGLSSKAIYEQKPQEVREPRKSERGGLSRQKKKQMPSPEACLAYLRSSKETSRAGMGKTWARKRDLGAECCRGKSC